MKRRDFVKTVSAAGAGLLLRSPFSLHAQQPQADPSVKRVLVMFKCHFDAGFIDTQYNVVHKRYFEQFFPQAIEISRAANAAGKRRYVWTTGSWLLAIPVAATLVSPSVNLRSRSGMGGSGEWTTSMRPSPPIRVTRLTWPSSGSRSG